MSDRDERASLRLFLIHFAGGSASMYSDWHGLLPTDVADQCVQLPGRQERRTEDAFTEIEPLVDAMLAALSAELDHRPYALFGHCLGAMLAYRLAIAAERNGLARPVLVGASGWAPAGFAMLAPENMRLPTAGFANWVRDVGLLPPEVFQDPQVLDLALPVLRADLSVYASYQDDGARSASPIVTYSGASDALMGPGAMASWSDRSGSYLGNCSFPGGHFFIREHAIAITADLIQRVRRQVHLEMT